MTEALLEAYPLGASTRNAEGRLPLHVMCISGASLPAVEMILMASPGSREMTDGRKYTPLQYAEESFHRNNAEIVDFLRHKIGVSHVQGTETVLYNLISEQRWNEVVAQARKVPGEASVWNIDGSYGTERLPIHLACTLSPPRRAIASLINVYAEGVRTPEKDGRTCLHAACHYGADIDVICLLINAHPDALLTSDVQGLLPVHIAISEGRVGMDVIKLLLRTSPEVSTLELEKGMGGGHDWSSVTALEYGRHVHHPNHDTVETILTEAPSHLYNHLVHTYSSPSLIVTADGEERTLKKNAISVCETNFPNWNKSRDDTSYSMNSTMVVSEEKCTTRSLCEDTADDLQMRKRYVQRKSYVQVPFVSV